VEGEIPLAAPHLADEGPVQAAGIGELFLAFSRFVATRPDAVSEALRRR